VNPDIETTWEELSARLRGFIARRVGDAAEAEDILLRPLIPLTNVDILC